MRLAARVMEGRTTDPWLAGLVAFALGVAFSWRPSFWFDEAATIAAADRSEFDLLRLLLNFDAVHGLYYLAMHGWFSLVPITELTARLPSAVGVGVGAAGMIVLGRLVADRRTAWAATVAFAVLPRVLWASTEARSFAITAALAVWLTVVLVIAATRRGGALWTLYALLLALATVTFLYLALLVPAHAVILLVLRRTRSAVAGFAIAAVAGVALASPVIALTVSQQGQIAWIGTKSPNYLTAVASDQWFTGSPLVAFVVAVVVVVGAIVLTRKPRAVGTNTALAVAVPWALVPTTLVIGYSILIDEIYQARYLTFTAPGLALLLGVCVTAISRGRTRVAIAVLGVLTLAATPAYVAQRSPYFKPAGADYSAIANVIGAQAHAGDCVAFDTSASWTDGPLRAAAAARPDSFSGLFDVFAGTSGPISAQLWTEDLPLNGDAETLRLDTCTALWFVTSRDHRSPELDYAQARGWVLEQVWDLNRSAVLLLKRK